MARGDNFRGQKPPGSGRKKGTGNKTTTAVKTAVLEALNADDGATAFFKRLKDEDARTFANVAAKLIPSEIVADISSHHDETHVPWEEQSWAARLDIARRAFYLLAKMKADLAAEGAPQDHFEALMLSDMLDQHLAENLEKSH